MTFFIYQMSHLFEKYIYKFGCYSCNLVLINPKAWRKRVSRGWMVDECSSDVLQQAPFVDLKGNLLGRVRGELTSKEVDKHVSDDIACNHMQWSQVIHSPFFPLSFFIPCRETRMWTATFSNTSCNYSSFIQLFRLLFLTSVLCQIWGVDFGLWGLQYLSTCCCFFQS